MALAEAGLVKVWLPACAAMLLGALIPLWTYPVLRFGGKISAVDSAAIAAHYGSVSAVTFITPRPDATHVDWNLANVVSRPDYVV